MYLQIVCAEIHSTYNMTHTHTQHTVDSTQHTQCDTQTQHTVDSRRYCESNKSLPEDAVRITPKHVAEM